MGGSAGYSLTIHQLCWVCAKAIHSVKMNVHARIPIKLYL